MKPEKFTTYSQINQTKMMQDHDKMIDWVNDLETKLASIEREVFCMREKCDACPGKCEDCPKDADSE